MRQRWMAVILIVCLSIGCGRQGPLNIEQDVQLGALGDSNIKSLPIAAASKEQKVSVLVRTNNVPIHVYVVQDKDAAKLDEQLSLDVASTVPLLAHKWDVKEGTLEATIPANSGFKVFLVNKSSTKATAAVKITASK